MNMNKPARLVALLLLLCLAAPLFAADYRDEALADAIMRGDRARVRSLLNSGANVNARLQEGYTPIMLAASFGTMDIVKILLDALRADKLCLVSRSKLHVAQRSF